MKSFAICGASGAVGKELLALLISHGLVRDISHVQLFASARSAGKTVKTELGDCQISEFVPEAVSGFDVVFLCVSGDFSKTHAKTLVAQNTFVIDNSSAFRYDDMVPLVVPEINAAAIGDSPLIANPNCTTAILAMALWPIYQEFGLKRVIVSTYQAASGAGYEGMRELEEATKAALAGEDFAPNIFQHPLAFNIIPHIDAPQENGYTKEEMKVVWETQKIFDNRELPISCTAVRIPALRAHSESVTVETERPVNVAVVRELLNDAPGVTVHDNLEAAAYPMPINVTGEHDVLVGRIRVNEVFAECGLDFFVSGDQLLRGAALNAVLIAQSALSSVTQ